MSTTVEIEPPECPVCLNPYDSTTPITPRVLPCGHSGCQDCLSLLSHPFPNTIRCPACTQLVKLTHPSSLPKNIDLLRFSSLFQHPKKIPNKNNKSLLSSDIEKPTKNESLPRRDHENPEKPTSDDQFVPNLWTQEFFLKWKKWVVSENEFILELNDQEGFFPKLHGKYSIKSETKKVSLVRIGYFDFSDDMKVRYSYVSKVMWVLHKMKDDERDEIGSILRVSSLIRVCKVYGLWYNDDDRFLYMVSERYANNLSDNISNLRNLFSSKHTSDELSHFPSFAMICMEMCEAISTIHSEGLFFGYLSVYCFCFDEFGHVYIDLNEAFVSCKRIGRLVKEVIPNRENGQESKIIFRNDALHNLAFVGPEIFIELSRKIGIDMECEIKMDIGHGSDVWSLACVFLSLFYGELFLKLVLVEGSDYIGFYRGLKDKVGGLLEEAPVSEIKSIQNILCNCLFLDPGDRPLVMDLWKCIRELLIKPQFDIVTNIAQINKKEGEFCLLLCELGKLGGEFNESYEKKLNEDENGEDDDVQVGENSRDLIEGISEGHIRCIDLKGHLDCVTGLATGGGYLFSSSFDKTVQVWSLQDFAHVHTYKGHENKVMTLVFVDKEQPLCISGDSGGGIFIWDVSYPLGQEPIKKLYEQKDWRYSGIHCLAVSGTEYLYTGSGDKSIKAWSLQDYTLSSVMNGHNSVVSTLSVCDGILYSGSWDGTVRLWCLSDHSPLAILGENVTSVLSLAAYGELLAVAHENGDIKIWRNNALLKCVQAHKGAIFSVTVGKKWLFTGGWDKTVNVQEILADGFQADAIPLGSIASDAVITALFYWQGKLFVGQADRVIKVYHYGS